MEPDLKNIKDYDIRLRIYFQKEGKLDINQLYNFSKSKLFNNNLQENSTEKVRQKNDINRSVNIIFFQGCFRFDDM